MSGQKAEDTARFALMKDHDCCPGLPVNDITEGFTFGQFIRLSKRLGDVVASVELAGPAQGNRALNVRSHPMVTLADGFPEEGGEPELLTPGWIRQVEVADLDELIATGRLSVDERPTEVRLDHRAISSLLRGRPTEVGAQVGGRRELLRLLPPPQAEATAEGPAVSEYVVDDLAGFLATRTVPGLRGLPFRLSLTAGHVRGLRERGRTEVSVAEGGRIQSVRLRMRPRDDENRPRDPGGDDNDPVPQDGQNAGSGEGAAPAGRGTPAPAGDQQEVATSGTGQVVLFLAWQQSWKLRGYSRGQLVTSLGLGPKEETTIEIFSWDRSRRTLEQSSSTDVEQSFESSDTTKDVVDVVRDMTRNENLQLQANASLRVMYGAVDAQIGGGVNRTETVGNVARRTANHLTEAVSRSATRVRTGRQTKISESTEVGREERVIRKVANHNSCRTLTLDYFEVLANYRITTTFAKDAASVCVLIGLPDQVQGLTWQREDVRTHERALRIALLDPAMAAGFDAARLLDARDRALSLVCQRAVCDPPKTTGGAGTGGGGSEEEPTAELRSARAALNQLSKVYGELRAADYGPLMDAWDDGYEPPAAGNLLAFRLWLYRALLERLLTRLKRALDRLQPDYTSATTADVQQTWGDIAAALPSPSGQHQLDTLDSNAADLSACIWPVVDRYSGTAAEANWYWNTFASWNANTPDDNGLPAALEAVRAAVSALAKSLEDGGEDGTPGDGGTDADQRQSIDTATDRIDYAFPLGDVARAAEREDALRRHLMAHDQYYKFAVFQMLPLGDQIQHFAGLGLPVELLEPRVIGAVQTGGGVLLAVPINPALSADAQRALTEFLDANPDVVNFSAYRDVSLPTPGLAVEGRLGACDCCEEDTTERLRSERRRTAADTALIEQQAAWQEQDARRLRMRLDQDPPDLSDPRDRPVPPELVVTLNDGTESGS